MKLKILSVLLFVLFLAGANFSQTQAQDVSPTPTPYVTPTLPPFDECLNIDGIQTEVPEGYQVDNQLQCTPLPLCDPENTDQGLCVTPTPTQVPPPPPPPSDHGDGQSDGRSDGGSSTPQSSNVLGASTGGSVLGASTDTLAATGSNDQLARMLIAATAALTLFLLGQRLVRDNETS